ncbi:MAG: hypothetical protein HYT83_03785 [Candidatus Levybacteria bacterium]|nr:hypothetical protein [Candidatus Levybacteria bacterium]
MQDGHRSVEMPMTTNWVDKFLQEKPLGSLEKDFRKGLGVFLPEARKLPSYRTDPALMERTQKVGTDFVTQTDRLMQQNLKSALLKDEDPTHYGFWGEEAPDNEINWQSYDRVWVSDPIEGTINYSGQRGNKDGQWGSVLGLVDSKTNTPLIGFVIDPITKELFFAIKGKGAYKVTLNQDWTNGELNQMSSQDIKLEQATITFNRSPHFSPELFAQSENFEAQLKAKGVNAIDPESGALEVVRHDGTVYFKTSNEMAAAMLFIDELGGKATDFEGNGWKPGIHSLIASHSPKIYEQLKSTIDQLAA